MLLLFCGIYFLAITFIGYITVSALLAPQRRNLAEIIGLSFSAGFGVVATALFLLSLAGFVPSATTLGGLAVLAVIGMIALKPRRWIRPAPFVRSSIRFDATAILGIVATIVITAAAANVVAEIRTSSLQTTDAYAIWMFKAKVVAMHPLRPIPAALLDPLLSYSHQDYPLGFPLVAAGLQSLPSVGEVGGKWVLLPVYLALIAITYGALRRILGSALAVSVTALLVAQPVLVQHAGMAVAEMPLVLLHTACLVTLLSWLETGDRRSLFAAAVFAAFAAFAKNEGLALLPLIGLAALAPVVMDRAHRTMAKSWCIAAGVTLLLLLPWLLYRRHLPHTHEDYGGKLTSVSTVLHDLPRLDEVLPRFVRLLVEPSTAGGIWLILLVTAGIGWRNFTHRPTAILWALLVAHLGLYAITFAVTPWDVNVLLPMVGPKLLMHVSPTAALLIALHLRAAPPARDDRENRNPISMHS